MKKRKKILEKEMNNNGEEKQGFGTRLLMRIIDNI